MQVVGLSVHSLQKVGLNCSHHASCGMKSVYTSMKKLFDKPLIVGGGGRNGLAQGQVRLFDKCLWSKPTNYCRCLKKNL